MKIQSTQNFEAFFEDYVKDLLAEEPPRLPPHQQKIGQTLISWFETDPGIFHLEATGGTIDDRAVAQLVVREQLTSHDLKQAKYSLDWDQSNTQLIKEAGWVDIEQKAKRLVEGGKVHILRNSWNTIVGQVEGDHGTYQTEISRDDPNSRAITLWQCECPWDQFAWQRTRQWKKYEGRPCAHTLALYWKALATPLDEDVEPGSSPSGPNPSGAPPGTLPQGMPTGEAPTGFNPSMQETRVAPGSQAPAPGQQQELIPPYPYNPENQPAVNPVSVPGLKPQTPLNPIQNAGQPGIGGTFSAIVPRVAAETFINGEMVSNNYEDMGEAVGLNPGESVTIPMNSVGEVFGQDPTTNMVQVYFAGPMGNRGPLEPHGVMAWFMPNEIRRRPDIRPPGPAVRRR